MDLSKIPESVMKFILCGSRVTGKRAAGGYSTAPVEVDANGNLRVAISTVAEATAIPVTVAVTSSLTAAVTGTIESAKGVAKLASSTLASDGNTTVFTAAGGTKYRKVQVIICPNEDIDVTVTVWHGSVGDANVIFHGKITAGTGPVAISDIGMIAADTIIGTINTGTDHKTTVTVYGELFS